MKREELVTEVQRRFAGIKTANGYTLDVNHVFRNPEEEPNPSIMPLVNLFEMPDLLVSQKDRGATKPPIATRELVVVAECWMVATSEGKASKEISQFLKAARVAIFNDGITLGKKGVIGVAEIEVSRVYRPAIGNGVVGIGQVLRIRYLEDYSQL